MQAAAPKGVAVLGSTGSIGTTALRVLDRQRQRFRVTALTANSNAALLREQARLFSPAFVGMVESSNGSDEAWKSGTDALVAAATRDDVDIVINAIVGAAGLDATLAALEAGKRVALANKETLVIAGDLVRQACASGSGEVVPVDSEHSAILQCITGHPSSRCTRSISLPACARVVASSAIRSAPASRTSRASSKVGVITTSCPRRL